MPRLVQPIGTSPAAFHALWARRVIAEETGRDAGDVEAATVAAALMGAQRALVTYVHASVHRGDRGRILVDKTRSQARRAFARLERGLDDYSVK